MAKRGSRGAAVRRGVAGRRDGPDAETPAPEIRAIEVHLSVGAHMTGLERRLAIDPLVARADALLSESRAALIAQCESLSAELRELQLDLTAEQGKLVDLKHAELSQVHGALAIALNKMRETWEREKARALRLQSPPLSAGEHALRLLERHRAAS